MKKSRQQRKRGLQKTRHSSIRHAVAEQDEPHPTKSKEQHQKRPYNCDAASSVVSKPSQHDPQEHGSREPRESRDISNGFWDLKASHWFTVALTVALVWIGVAQFCVYQRQAGIMATQTQILSAQLSDGRIVNRAWLTLRVTPERITFDDKGGGLVVFENSIQNVGHTTATDVWIDAWIDLPGDPQFNPTKKLADEIARIKTQKSIPGYQLLPGDGLTQQTKIGPITPQNVSGFPFATFVVKYRLPFDNTVHVTCYTYEVMRLSTPTKPGDDRDIVPFWNSKDGNISADKMAIQYWPFFGSCGD